MRPADAGSNTWLSMATAALDRRRYQCSPKGRRSSSKVQADLG